MFDKRLMTPVFSSNTGSSIITPTGVNLQFNQPGSYGNPTDQTTGRANYTYMFGSTYNNYMQQGDGDNSVDSMSYTEDNNTGTLFRVFSMFSSWL